jgi:hypothetical protein
MTTAVMSTVIATVTIDWGDINQKPLQIIVGTGGGAVLLAIIIIATVCVCKKRKSDDSMPVVYGSALGTVRPSAGALPIDQSTVRAAPLPEALAPSVYRDQMNSQAPEMPSVAPPMQGNYGKLPDGPLTASPDAAPDIYAEISNVALPGMPGSAPSLSHLPPPPGADGYGAPAPPRPDILPPPL